MPRPLSRTLLLFAPAIWMFSVAGPRRPTSDGLKRTVRSQDGGVPPVDAGKLASAWQPVPASVYSPLLGPEIVKVVPSKGSGELPWLKSVTVRSSRLLLSTSTPGSAPASNRLDLFTVASAPGLPCSWTVVVPPSVVPTASTRRMVSAPLRGPAAPAVNRTFSARLRGAAETPVVKQPSPPSVKGASRAKSAGKLKVAASARQMRMRSPLLSVTVATRTPAGAVAGVKLSDVGATLN
jgi:hypothetical protein